jgi:hypothetical protein
VSTTDNERLGLGWEVWFLLLGLAVGGLALTFLPGIIGVAFEVGPPNPLPTEPVTVDTGRLVVGVGMACAFAAVAIRIIRTTDWRLD